MGTLFRIVVCLRSAAVIATALLISPFLYTTICYAADVDLEKSMKSSKWKQSLYGRQYSRDEKPASYGRGSTLVTDNAGTVNAAGTIWYSDATVESWEKYYYKASAFAGTGYFSYTNKASGKK